MNKHNRNPNRKALLKQQEKRYFENHFQEDDYDEETFKFIYQTYGKSNSTIIDLGCGSGGWTKNLAKKGNNVIGVDFSFLSVKEMYRTLKNSNCEAIVADVESLPLKDHFADQCFFGWLLHHVSNIYRCLEEAARCLQHNGSMVLIEPNGSNFVRTLTHRIGIMLNKVRKKRVSTYIERPLDVIDVCRILNELGFNFRVFPFSASERTIMKGARPSFLVRIYVLVLRLTSLLLPGIFGASDFILFAFR